MVNLSLNHQNICVTVSLFWSLCFSLCCQFIQAWIGPWGLESKMVGFSVTFFLFCGFSFDIESKRKPGIMQWLSLLWGALLQFEFLEEGRKRNIQLICYGIIGFVEGMRQCFCFIVLILQCQFDDGQANVWVFTVHRQRVVEKKNTSLILTNQLY